MMHDRADTIDADLSILGFAIPQPPVQPASVLDDHRLRRHPRRIIGRQAAADLLQVEDNSSSSAAGFATT
jgi:hypothetical protein